MPASLTTDFMSALKHSRLFVLQAVLILVAAVVCYLLQGVDALIAAFYGGLIVVINSLLQLWHYVRAERIAQNDVGRTLGIAMRCEVERLGASIALFAIGFGKLHLPALPLIGTFIVVLVATLPFGLQEFNLRKSDVK